MKPVNATNEDYWVMGASMGTSPGYAALAAPGERRL